VRDAPKIDSRSGEEVFLDVQERLGIGIDRDDPLAVALLRVFSRYCELIIERLNRVPEKNHLVFLDTLNVSRMPPVPAQVPLTFNPVKKLPETQTAIIVPAQTQVAAAPGPGETETVVFETSRELALTQIKLEKIVALDPQTDLFSDKSSLATPEGGPFEFAFLARNPVAHEFYVRHGEIFARPGISWLNLKFNIGSGGGRAWQQHPRIEWLILTADKNISLVPVKDTTSGLTKSGEVTFANLPEWPVDNVFGRQGRWLTCRLLDRLPHPEALTETKPRSEFPPIELLVLSAGWQVIEGPLKAAFYNTLAIDLSRDFFPFGERPRFNDVFYVSSDAFARPRASVVLTISLTNPASGLKSSPLPRASQAGHPAVQWEYWDGKRWIKLGYRDSSEALTVDGQVTFTLPPSAQPTMVNGLEDFWMRARLVAGNYGEDERVEFSAAGGYQRIPSTLAPPSIQSITVNSSVNAGPVQPDAIVTHNNFVMDEVKEGSSFRPFIPAVSPYKTLYLGFDVPHETLNALADRAIDLYFHIRCSSEKRPYLRDAEDQALLKLTWQYWNGKDWKDASVNDATESLTVPGVVTVRAGDDIAPWLQSTLGRIDLMGGKRPEIARELYWLTIAWTGGEFGSQPDLTRLLLNTIFATHTMTLKDELLGSSTGKPDQRFYSARRPILRELRLEVGEPDMPEAVELQGIRATEGEDAVTIVRDVQGRVEHVWVRWHEVENWLSSTHRDRHFVVNRETGEIMFGDGKRGRIPPAGTNNVRLKLYQTGGGAAGNKAAGTIVQLRTTVPYVDSVNNLEPASGGQDMEDWDSLRERGSRWLRHRDRAVTVEDYEDLAKLASPVVAKAKCYSTRDLALDPTGKELRPGSVSIVIVPHGEDPRPQPDLGLLRRVRDSVYQRRVPDASLVVLGPEYVRISVAIVVVAEAAYAGASVVLRCEETLSRYLHPVTGGDYGRGWDFGARPRESDLYALLESVQGLRYVRSLDVRAEEGRPGLLQDGNFLISSGEHRIHLDS
jgi:hypothetical protein